MKKLSRVKIQHIFSYFRNRYQKIISRFISLILLPGLLLGLPIRWLTHYLWGPIEHEVVFWPPARETNFWNVVSYVNAAMFIIVGLLLCVPSPLYSFYPLEVIGVGAALFVWGIAILFWVILIAGEDIV